MRLELASIPTTHGTGPFYPAIRTGRAVYYWPEYDYEDEDEAYKTAKALWQKADDAIAKIAESWNVRQLESY